MDWNKAVEINRIALTQILDEIFALLELVLEGTITRLPQLLYHAAENLLRPTEAAVRRLIIIAARGLKAESNPHRPMPKGLVIVRKGLRPKVFPLFDARKNFSDAEPAITGGPRIHSLDSFFAAHAPVTQTPVTSFDATQLCRRYHSLKRALETLPQQALRLARWKARRAEMENAKFRSPIRPGKPPGHRDKRRHDIDDILKECHGLAFDALREDTS